MSRFYRQYQASAGWRYAAYLLTAVVLTPILVVFAAWALPRAPEHWEHLRSFVLAGLLWNTVWLLVGVCGLSAVLGVSLAWILAQCEFWGARFLRRAVLMPFALPPYVLAFVYVGLLDYAGPVRQLLRETLGSDAWVPEIRSLGGAILLLTLALFPYVYVLAFDAFSTQGRSTWEAARSLGARPREVFRRLALSFARPWLAGGLCLVALEVLNDFGTVSVVGVSTFTTAIYKVWFGFFSPETAAQLSSFLILLAFGIYYSEQRTRRGRSYSNPGAATLARSALSGHRQILAFGYVAGIFLVSFVIPFAQLLLWAYRELQDYRDPALILAFARSLQLAALVALATCIGGALMVWAKRFFPIPRLERSAQLSQLGYGIPGAVLAIGVFLPMVRADQALVRRLENCCGYDGGLLLTATLGTLALALTIRFLAVAQSTLEAGLTRVSKRLDEAASVFGIYGWQSFRLIHWPLVRASFFSAFLLVFVDVIKEMPLTLMTRPFGWDTLSVRIYSLVSEGEWQRAAVPSTLLVLLGILPLLLFAQKRS